ncbi:SpoIID/LytB domain-containing protein [Criblamydia sequanensis]|uniref:Conserved putative secreted protein n=1 Tax=Candidatus Criblamydia sequanensis CRIB-18 TaxID=1437425 RepID=A0A090CYF2_9BACT|nr:SpoIID/LytB domain-containing protein [Criblamydia sequanensis]CDR33386.1 Conserved putative secreted protein [Criblamydia sequanensis CRIB-18]
MIARVILTLIALIPLSCSLEAGTLWDSVNSYFSKKIDTTPTLRILVAKERTALDMAIQGKFRIYDPKNGELLATRKLGRSGPIEATSAGIKWGEGFPGIHQLLIVPDHIGTTIALDGKEYQGSLYVYEIDGKLNAINRIGVEELLYSVLSQDFNEYTPQELLASLAIVARTNAYFLADNPKNPFWTLDAEQINYNGINRSLYNPAVEEAVRHTRYMVLSKKSSFDAVSSTFPAFWADASSKLAGSGKVGSKISISEAKPLADRGQTASQILAKAFPGTEIVLIQNTTY